ncbi:hypothetical protein L798_00193 [Zootermopsis nevadensis]|uniref:Uncharacterized protein n=1 Tax=Zootermopsis nevadensis TaxID=136037 RepID=A0A067QNX7_ZOONE|nr:hypothetical protein L798_00193 [Zootermopsis nevadensis]
MEVPALIVGYKKAPNSLCSSVHMKEIGAIEWIFIQFYTAANNILYPFKDDVAGKDL